MGIKLLYIDLFCGAGGTSTGIEKAKYKGEKCAKVIACVDNDANAIAGHSANHPDALHFTEDIRTLDLSPLVLYIEKMKAAYPEALVALWASLECTNFSNAKGGRPRDADSRTLAYELFRYIGAIHPDYIQIENVEEFMSWGDLDANGKPVSRDKGKKYLQWVEHVKEYGYTFQHRILNAADYGAYTSRKRFFGIFAKNKLPVTFPKPTHSKNPTFGQLEKWKPIKDILDFSDDGQSIFTREKPLSDKTLERIYAGLIKFVAGGKNKVKFLVNEYSSGGQHSSIDEGCPTILTHPKQKVVNCITDTGRIMVKVCGTDTEPMRKIKEFMAMYGIVDIKMRMLRIPELKQIMGFPKNYKLIGTQTEQKKFIGNAVEVNMARVLCEALIEGLEKTILNK